MSDDGTGITPSDEHLSDAEWGTLQANPAAMLDDGRPAVRRLAIARCGDALGRGDESMRAPLEAVLAGAAVAYERAAAAEGLGGSCTGSIAALLAATQDGDVAVVEAAVTALGGCGDDAALPRLVELAIRPGESMIREAAVAALGEIGDGRAVDPLLELLASGPPQVRRRCVVALTVFEDDRIEPAIRAATSDRNPMVREVAEMVAGHSAEWQPLNQPASGHKPAEGSSQPVEPA